jgi:hypothetical protein
MGMLNNHLIIIAPFHINKRLTMRNSNRPKRRSERKCANFSNPARRPAPESNSLHFCDILIPNARAWPETAQSGEQKNDRIMELANTERAESAYRA